LLKERAAAEGRLRRERNRRRFTLVATAVAVIGVLIGLRGNAQREEFARRKHWANLELARGREYVRAGDHVSALGVLDGLTDTLRDGRRLADVEAAAKELRELASRELAMRQAAEAEATADRDWYGNLARRREDAFLSYSMFRDEDRKRWASHVARRSRLALEVAGYRDGDKRWGGPARAGRTLSAEERKDIRASVLALFLILADVESQSLPVKDGVDPVDEARRLLTTATALQGEFHTRAYGRIRDEIASRLGEKRGRTEPPREAGGPEPVPNEYDDYLLGQIDYSHGSPDSAVSNLKLAQRNQPSRRIWTQFLLAKCFLKLGRPFEAKAELDECVRARPDLAWSYMLRGTANDQAARSAKLRAASEPWRAAAWNEEVRRLTEVADEDYREALARTDVPGERAVIHFARHTLRLLPKDSAGTAPDLEGAARELEQARRLSDGGWIQPYISLAYVLHQLRREDQAQQSLVEAIRRFPDSPLPHRTRAGLILKKNPLALADVDRILEYLEPAIRLEKDNPRSKARDLVVKAHMLSERREFARAAEIADESLQVSKEDLAAHLCKIEALMGARRHDEAGAACRLALEAGHRRPILYEVHGLLFARRRDYPAAIEAYTSALTLDPYRTSLHLVRGWSYLAANSPQMARPDFEKALKNGDAPAEAHCGLGAASVALRRDREALDHARSALEGGSIPTALTLYRVARIHAQAADLTNDVDAVRQRLDYTQRLLVAASERLPAIDHRPFWQEIDKDPSLRALHRRLGYAEWFRRSSSTNRYVAGTKFDPTAMWTGHESPPVVGGPSSRLRSELRSLAEIEGMPLREIESDR
jgi:tetratricopeptide (TPR) repeat protein